MTALAATAWLGGWRRHRELCDALLARQPAARDSAAAHWSGDAVALARRPAATPPEDRHDRGMIIGGGGSLILAGDMRLDNRDELAAALGLGGEAPKLADTALALRAIERWGIVAVERLIGDMAFILWDGSRQCLYLARDAIGGRPLHFARLGKGVAVASTAYALAGLAREGPNSGSATRFLAGLPLAHGESFFAGVERVEPGEVVTLTAARSDRRRWWRPRLDPDRTLSAAARVEALGTLFDAAVQARLRGATHGVATHLSAGIDSGAVTATAARLMPDAPVHGFTAVPPAGWRGVDDEGPGAARLAATHCGIVHHRVTPRSASLLDQLDSAVALYGRPLTNLANQLWLGDINDAVQARGIGVLLSGGMGNLTISYGGGDALGELLRRGEWRRAAAHALVMREAGRRWRDVIAAAARAALPMRTPPFGPPLIASGAVMPRWDAPRGSAAQRLAIARRIDPGDFGKAVLARWRIDLRDPTADRRVIEFCLRMPVEDFAPGGVERGLAHKLFADRLPATTLTPGRRFQQAGWWHGAARAERARLRDEVAAIAASDAAAAVVDVAQLRRLVDAWPDHWPDRVTEARYRMRVLPALATGHFLRRCAS